MKKFLIAAVLMALVFAVQAIDVDTTGMTLGGSLKLSGLKYTPYPAQPGSYIDVWIGIQNAGKTAMEGANCSLDLKYPFSIDAGDSPDYAVPYLQIGQSATAKYKIRIDANAVQGTNELAFKCRAVGGYGEVKVNIFIQSQDADIMIKSVESDPKEISPGSEAKITITLENAADSYLRDVKIKLDVDSDDLPFAPIGSATEQRIKVLAPKTEEKLVFELAAFPSAKAQIYKVPIAISFYDEVGELHTKNELTGITVGGRPEISAFIDSTDIKRPNTVGSVFVKVVNNGVIDVKFMKVKVTETGDFQLASSAEAYMGTLNSDDDDSVEFKLFVKQTGNYNVNIPVQLVYRDANNNEYAEEKNITLRVYTEDEIARLQLEQQQGLGLATIIILLIVAAYVGNWAFKKWFQKKKA